MEESIIPHKYELAYHLMPDLEADKLKEQVLEIESFITQNGGTVVISRDVRRIHLSYPIDHKHYANFGVIDFDAPTESIKSLDGQLKLQDSVLRFLIVAKDMTGKELRTLADKRIRRAKPLAPGAPAAVATTPEQEVAKQEKMTAELEDVLGKI